MITQHLHMDHHISRDEAPFVGVPDEHCNNVIDTLYEVAFEIDPADGKVHKITLNNGQVFEL